jgi:hypothetical protein
VAGRNTRADGTLVHTKRICVFILVRMVKELRREAAHLGASIVESSTKRLSPRKQCFQNGWHWQISLGVPSFPPQCVGQPRPMTVGGPNPPFG